MKKRLTVAITAIVLTATMLAGCSAEKTPSSAPVVPTNSTTATETRTPSPAPTDTPAPTPEPTERTFTDSSGREIIIPVEINSFAPSGLMAQMFLYTLAPEKMAGRSNDFSNDAKQLLPEKYVNLPLFGQFYGSKASLNMEELVKAAPDLIIDIGTAKSTVVEDMNGIQEKTGIPAAFVSSTILSLHDTYVMLGELTNMQERASQLAEYCREALSRMDASKELLKDTAKPTVYIAIGENGLKTDAAGSFHAQLVDMASLVNVADIDPASSGGGSEISFEQLLVWQPDFVICENAAVYEYVTTDSTWQTLEAVKNGNVFLIPNAPYNIFHNPPSINSLIGINWLINIAYPKSYADIYESDFETDLRDFYDIFYSLDLTDEQFAQITEHSLR